MFWGLYVYIMYQVAMVGTIHWLRADNFSAALHKIILTWHHMLFFQRFNAYKYHWSDTRLPVVLEVTRILFLNTP